MLRSSFNTLFNIHLNTTSDILALYMIINLSKELLSTKRNHDSTFHKSQIVERYKAITLPQYQHIRKFHNH
jgi:hypothetical protein